MKTLPYNHTFRGLEVASFAEAWIEKYSRATNSKGETVASFAEAWIENIKIVSHIRDFLVASFAEAWIEKSVCYDRTASRRRLLRGGVD